MSGATLPSPTLPSSAQKAISAALTQTSLSTQSYFTYQAASVDTHCSGLPVAGCAIKHAAKVVVEVVTQGQTAQFTGVRAWQGISPVSDSLRYYGKKAQQRDGGRWLRNRPEVTRRKWDRAEHTGGTKHPAGPTATQTF